VDGSADMLRGDLHLSGFRAGDFLENDHKDKGVLNYKILLFQELTPMLS